jgi:hypothetical protein
VAEVRLWPLPYETIVERMQFAQILGEWQKSVFARFSVGRGTALGKARILHLKHKFTGESGAADLYQLARPSDREMEAEKADPKIQALVRLAKTDASYWLGLIAMEQGNHRAAIDYFAKRVLEASPGSAWTHGARYNLARAYEAAGQPDKAIEIYESDVRSPTYRGNLLRARWLGSKTSRLPAEVPQETPPGGPNAQPPKKPSDKSAPPPADKPGDKPPGQPAGSPASPPADKKAGQPAGGDRPSPTRTPKGEPGSEPGAKADIPTTRAPAAK